MRKSWIPSLALVALLLVTSPAVLAGKGNGKGKPGDGGGGDGGGETPVLQEIAYVAEVTRKGVASRRLQVGPVDGSAFWTELDGSADPDLYPRELAWSPDGGAFAFRGDGSWTVAATPSEITVVDRETGLSTELTAGYRCGCDVGGQRLSWTARRDASGQVLPFDQQYLLTREVQAWGPRPCGDAFTLETMNLVLLPADPVGARHDPVPLTTFGWSEETLADGSVIVRRERALSGHWVGERVDRPDRAWVIYTHEVRTYTPPVGESAWCNQANEITDVVALRVLTIDLSGWPQVDPVLDVLADRPLIDVATGAAFDPVPYEDEPVWRLSTSADGRYAGWIGLDGTLRRAPLVLEPLPSAPGEVTLAVDRSEELTVPAPAEEALWARAVVALGPEGGLAAASLFDGSGWGAFHVHVYDFEGATWTRVTSNKNPCSNGGIAFGPAPSAGGS